MRRRAAGVLGAALAVAGTEGLARAEAAPDRQRSPPYYYGHGALTFALAGAGLVLARLEPVTPGGDPSWFPGDACLRGVYSPQAARLSDILLLFGVFDPLVASIAQGVDWRLANRSVVYSETLAANLALNSLAKVTFGRPRPYTYSEPPGATGDDRYVSFYSGHASTVFAAAVSGSYLFAESAPDKGSSYFLWGSEFFLAAMTANLRLRAGKHYYSDVIVGALVGSGIGAGMLLAHGAEYRPSGVEYALAGGGIVVGTALAQILPFQLERPAPLAGLDSFTLSPWSLGREALGVQAAGTF